MLKSSAFESITLFPCLIRVCQSNTKIVQMIKTHIFVWSTSKLFLHVFVLPFKRMMMMRQENMGKRWAFFKGCTQLIGENRFWQLIWPFSFRAIWLYEHKYEF